MVTIESKKYLLRYVARIKKVTCAYCGKEMNESEVTVDHIHPKSLGGTNDYGNLVTCCLRCNQNKADRTFDKWINKIDICNIINNIIVLSEFIPKSEYATKISENKHVPKDVRKLIKNIV